jgi:hypothetical protein
MARTMYREQDSKDLDEAARETDAVFELIRRRDHRRIEALLVGVGVALLVGWWGWGRVPVDIGCTWNPMGALIGTGLAVVTFLLTLALLPAVVACSAPRWLRQLSKRYRVPLERLETIDRELRR